MRGVAVFGVTGRMGQALVKLLAAKGHADQAYGLTLCGGLCAPNDARRGKDAAADGTPSGVIVTDDPGVALQDAAVAVDFSSPRSTSAHAEACVRSGVPLLVGTTGLEAGALAALGAAAVHIPVLLAPNTSVGIAVLMQLVARATSSLGAGFDVEILEAHHRLKRDAPSGTALALGQVIAETRGETLPTVAITDRFDPGAQPRQAGGIGFAVLRAGDIVGEHTVVFAGTGERLEITHRAADRALFARGALRAAAWLAGRRAGMYAMDDALGLR